ncbi:transporter [Stenotrophomonas pictorum JCM 9942]|jgi:predicted MFS family arabinose efflux permease|uniref:Transporter n=2 Tax=Stenotrophomonas pictorum TaxID=86184 RepID=A0A0R0ABI4_9GAMM|nr:MFS transporter [Stenotrophomonas pictorum]KRG42165.1 transporter [Stenotrophomonas pictorum JCM 9942]
MNNSAPVAAASRPLSSALVLLLAIAVGLVVASNYYAQPLLQLLAGVFDVSAGMAGWVVTVAQLAYAAGLLLIVPLGDRLERRGLIVGLFVLASVGLGISASAGNFVQLLAGTALAGLSAVAAQIIIPHAATLARPEQRGRVVGTLMAGLLLGILLARTASGLLAGIGSWHTIYWVACVALLLCALVLARLLPPYRPTARLSYPRLIGSVLVLLRDEPLLRRRSLLGALLFAGFSVFWTPLAFLLSGPAYGYSISTIGLFGLVGAAGALAASRAGRLSDRGLGRWVAGGGLMLLLLSWLVLALAPVSLAALVVGVLLLDIAVQAVHINNQSAIYQLDENARSRITSAYMTCYFIGGASGSALGTAAWTRYGWNGVCVLGGGLALLGLLVFFVPARRSR